MRHRTVVGGLWNEMGSLQLYYMIKNGLRPEHKLLDIGCGSLRGGVRFIPYLMPGNYFGIDKSQTLVDRGLEIELGKAMVEKYKPTISVNKTFSVPKGSPFFDYMIAQSVFTHLTLDEIKLCLFMVMPWLKEEGKFYATFFKGDPEEKIVWQAGNIHSSPDADPYHYSVEMFEDLSNELGININYIGDWGHPRNQKMLEITHDTA